MAEEVGVMLQRGLAEWWSEETEYIFQRIERWAAYARGYNRLRSQRLSRGRMTMQGGQEARWSIASNKLIIDDSSWSPRFHSLKKSRRKSRPEEAKINCCGSFNYQSSSKLDSNCLETYRYDHSIYFKTIGDIRNSKKLEQKDDRVSISSEELVEWDANAVSDFIANQILEDSLQNALNVMDDAEDAWFNVDLAKLDLSEADALDEQNNRCGAVFLNEENNNMEMQNHTRLVVQDDRRVVD